MSDTATGDNGLPPKLNLSKKIAKPVAPKKLATVLKPKAPSVASPVQLKTNPKPIKTSLAQPKTFAPANTATILKPKSPSATAPVKLGTKQETSINPLAQPKPAITSPAPSKESPGSSPNTSRIKLTAKPSLKSAPKKLDKTNTPPLATQQNKQNPEIKVEAVKPQTVLKAKTNTSPATVKLKPKPSRMAPVTPKPVATETVATAKSASTKLAPTTPVTLKAKPIGLKPKAVSLKPKPAMGLRRNEADTNAPIGSKRATAKISFDNDSVNTKTINIKPSADIEGLRGKAPVTLNPTIHAKIPDIKRQTSRISLEAALGTEDEKQSGPKTIRLKRPSKTPTIKVSAKKPDSSETLSKTSKIEMPKDSDIPATQKATIKIKRPSKKRSAKTVSLKRKDTEQTDETTADADTPITSPLQPLKSQSAPDSTHWTFIVSAIAAIFIACALIYVLCAQAFGPDLSLTKLSYGGSAILQWPGRILR